MNPSDRGHGDDLYDRAFVEHRATGHERGIEGGSGNCTAGDYEDIPHEWIPILCDADRVSLLDYDGSKVPCIMVDDRRYERIMMAVSDMRGSIETTLNIFDDMEGRVFVRISMDMPRGKRTIAIRGGDAYDDNHNNNTAAAGLHAGEYGTAVRRPDPATRPEQFMLDARLHLKFFEALAATSLLALVPVHARSDGGENLVVIQMPRQDRAYHALDLIRRGLG